MVDFDTNALVLTQLGVTVVAASVDGLDHVRALQDGLRLRFVRMVGEVDGPAVAAATGAALQTGDRTFLHATGFLLDPSGAVLNSVYSSGPIGRFTADDVLRRVAFEQRARAKAKA